MVGLNSTMSGSTTPFIFIVGVIIFSFAYYAQSMEYLGCHVDNPNNRILTGRSWKDDRMTLQMCQHLCTNNSSNSYFGVQYFHECFCGDDISRGKGGASESDCSAPCRGNQSQICGGTNRISVYSVCPRGYYGTECSNRCYCKNDVICKRIDGLCPAGCQAGWKENSCSEDINECSGTNGGCQQICNNTVGSYHCSCTSNYTLEMDGKSCKDNDECASNSTNDCMHNCINTPGSYNCSCWGGYDQISRTDCNETDECVMNNGGCEQKCINTPGNYKCSCRTGFVSSTVNTSNCEDADECSMDNGGCQHNCSNSIGSYMCSCHDRFILLENKHNCTEFLVKSSESWKWIIIGVFAAVGLVLALVLVVVLCRRCRNESSPDSKISWTKPLSIIEEAATKLQRRKGSNIQSDDVTAATGSDINLIVNDDVSNPTYENFSPAIADTAVNTRLRVDDLSNVIERIRSTPQTLEQEFKNVPEKSEQSCSFAEQKDLKSKNKYKNILPYNYNRVTLSQIGDDKKSTYINASFIDGYLEQRKYIASHGPLNTTTEDFWRMVWEYKVTVIVMLTNCKEKAKIKCEQYWPNDTTTANTYRNDLSVKLDTVSESMDHVIRTLILSDGQEKRELTQIQYTAWPDHGVPPYTIPLLSLRHTVKSLTSSYSNTSNNKNNRNSSSSNIGDSSNRNSCPILVHCSAGVGRTGTYIGLDILLDEAEDRQEFDICNTVTSLRNQRMNSVQTLDQYTFIYKALYEGLIFGVTKIPACDVRQKVSKLREIHPITGQTKLDTEFRLLGDMQPPYTDDKCSEALSSKNISKNRDPKLVPSNVQRVFYTNEADIVQRYINAVMIPCHKKKEAYIATQLPMQNTQEDFWRLCLDYKCRLVVCLIKEEDKLENEDLSGLLPKDGEWLSCGKISVGNVSKHSKHEDTDKTLQKSGGAKDGCSAHMLTIRDGDQPAASVSDPAAIYENTQGCKNDVEVTVFLATLSSNQTELINSILDTHKSVTSLMKKNRDQAPILVVSRTGVDLCGPYIATSKCLSTLQSDDMVDVIQSVLDLKQAQPHFMSTLEEYELIYRTLDQYCSQTSMYVNSSV